MGTGFLLLCTLFSAILSDRSHGNISDRALWSPNDIAIRQLFKLLKYPIIIRHHQFIKASAINNAVS